VVGLYLTALRGEKKNRAGVGNAQGKIQAEGGVSIMIGKSSRSLHAAEYGESIPATE